MAYKIDDDLLQNFDYYPKVFAAGVESQIHIRPLGGRPCFLPGQNYKLIVCALEQGKPQFFPVSADFSEFTVTANESGGIDFTHTFPKEQQYFLRFFDMEGNYLNQFPVYCVEGDLVGRYPFLGDTHLHTTFSDGRQLPEVVCANYRKYGYDFLAITDHHRYYPSLRAMEIYREIPTELCICPGEEVQLPAAIGQKNDIHIVNFGGLYSVNNLVPGVEITQLGSDPKLRSVSGECPESMDQAAYDDLMERLCADIQVPEGVDPFPAASCKWIFEQIRKAGGLGIFAHPNWINDVYHVPEKFVDMMVEEKWFDAFEVLGGENYYEHNGFQTVRYYQDWARGYRYPIVGATDSHNSNESNGNKLLAATIVFSPVNERTALIDSIKDFYSVAVDRISKEHRMVGDSRLVRYGWFLLKYYFPLHDALCQEEGRMMKQYVTGTEEEREEALRVLMAIHGRVSRNMKKNFAF